MNELEVRLQLVVVAGCNGLLAPEEGEVVRERCEEDAEEETCCCRSELAKES